MASSLFEIFEGTIGAAIIDKKSGMRTARNGIQYGAHTSQEFRQNGFFIMQRNSERQFGNSHHRFALPRQYSIFQRAMPMVLSVYASKVTISK